MSITRTAAALLSVTAFPLLAQEIATGDEIRTAVTGNTVQGTMVDTGGYTEFYAEDGTIRGDGYTGAWTVENDQMCFAYGDAPDCWNVAISGADVRWIQDGADRGGGTIVPGNPNAF